MAGGWQGNVRVRPGWRGNVRVGYNQTPAQRGWVGNVRVGPGYEPPIKSNPPDYVAPPTGSYDPTRDVQSEEAERGLGQLEGKLGTQRVRGESDYQTNVDLIHRREGQEATDFQTAQQKLKEAFQRLGGQQSERANAAGVLSGGAMLQAAAARAANEGKESQAQQSAYSRQKEGDQLDLGHLAREWERQQQDLGTEGSNAQANTAFTVGANRKLAWQEANERGVPAPKTFHWSRNPLVRARQRERLKREGRTA